MRLLLWALGCAVADLEPRDAVAAAVAAFNERAASDVAAPRTPSAVILSGYLRTGIDGAVVANWRETILEPLRPDLFWSVSESEARAAVIVPATLRAIAGAARRATVLFADEDRFKRLERNCSATADASANNVSLRNCLPHRAQFFAFGVAWARVVARERAAGARYAWVLKIRGDMVHARPLPPIDAWAAAPRAVFLDGTAWQAPCSHARSRCGCLCVGDRFIVAARERAAAVFGVADAVLAAGGCAATDSCPRVFRGNTTPGQAECYPGPATRLFPECLLGSALLAAGLAGDDLRPLPSGTILSCGPAGNASDHRTADADDRGCVPHWRSGSRKDLGEGISARPIPPLRPAKHFW